MIEPLSLSRFRNLADAYGGVIARWPAEYRDAAEAMARSSEAATVLAEASSLDRRMDGWRMPTPSHDLVGRVTAKAPAARREVARRMRLWWSGLGLAATLAGAGVGVASVAIATPVATAVGSATAFGDISNSDG